MNLKSMTDEQVEMEIQNLIDSENVKLAKRESSKSNTNAASICISCGTTKKEESSLPNLVQHWKT